MIRKSSKLSNINFKSHIKLIVTKYNKDVLGRLDNMIMANQHQMKPG